jgi:hypothetical protein
VCHVTGSKKHPAVTVTVSEHAAASVIKHGGHLGACTGSETAKPKGKPADALAKAKGADNPTPTAKDNAKVKHSGETEHTTTSATTTTTTTAAAAPTKGDGSKGSDHSQGSNDQGKSSGQGSNGSGHGKH